MKTRNLLVLGLVAVAALTPALARVDFKPIAGSEFTYVADITSDGSKLFLYASYATHFTYTEAGGLVDIGGIGCSGAPAMSRDGSVIASTVYDEFGICQAAKWLGGQDWLPMGSEPGAVPCGDSLSSVFDANNTTAVGLFWRAQECRAIGGTWDLVTGTAGPALTSTVPDRPTRGNGITEDGRIVVGWQDDDFGRRAVKWVDGVQEYIVDAEGNNFGEVIGLNSTGSVMWGVGYRYDGTGRGWLYRDGQGFLPMGQGGVGRNIQSVPTAASEDGSVVVGITRDFDFFKQTGWIWTAKKGWSTLNDFLKGQSAAGWDLNAPGAVSADGRIIAGTGLNPDGVVQAYIIDLKATGKQ